MTAPADLTDAADRQRGRPAVTSFSRVRDETRRKAWDNARPQLRRIVASAARGWLDLSPADLPADVHDWPYSRLTPEQRGYIAAAALRLSDAAMQLSDVGLPST